MDEALASLLHDLIDFAGSEPNRARLHTDLDEIFKPDGDEAPAEDDETAGSVYKPV